MIKKYLRIDYNSSQSEMSKEEFMRETLDADHMVVTTMENITVTHHAKDCDIFIEIWVS